MGLLQQDCFGIIIEDETLGDFYSLILGGDGGSNVRRILQHDFRGT